jgi:hypothetical protein
MEIAKRIVSTDRFQQLPAKFDVHEWAIMQEFFEFGGVRQSSRGSAEGYSRPRCIPALQRHASAHQTDSAWLDECILITLSAIKNRH